MSFVVARATTALARPGFVEKNKDQIHDEASDLIKFSKAGALHKAFAYVEMAQKARADALAAVRFSSFQFPALCALAVPCAGGGRCSACGHGGTRRSGALADALVAFSFATPILAGVHRCFCVVEHSCCVWRRAVCWA